MEISAYLQFPINAGSRLQVKRICLLISDRYSILAFHILGHWGNLCCRHISWFPTSMSSDYNPLNYDPSIQWNIVIKKVMSMS